MPSMISQLAVLSALLLQAAAQTLSISSVGAIGTGCSPGTVKAHVNQADQSVSLQFSNFRADAGPNYAISDGRVNCQLTVGVQVPAGYQFAFDQTVLNTAYSVSSGVKVSSSTTYYFQGELSESSGTCGVTGPASSSYTTLVNRLSPTIWSPCGKASIVSINTDLRADNGNTNNSGSISVRNSTDASFIWRKC
ncbi:hypothetical protein H1R20_g14325, partial [Candolleomyces eurysporus]